mgnify:CR=1 FL=1
MMFKVARRVGPVRPMSCSISAQMLPSWPIPLPDVVWGPKFSPDHSFPHPLGPSIDPLRLL